MTLLETVKSHVPQTIYDGLKLGAKTTGVAAAVTTIAHLANTYALPHIAVTKFASAAVYSAKVLVPLAGFAPLALKVFVPLLALTLLMKLWNMVSEARANRENSASATDGNPEKVSV